MCGSVVVVVVVVVYRRLSTSTNMFNGWLGEKFLFLIRWLIGWLVGWLTDCIADILVEWVMVQNFYWYLHRYENGVVSGCGPSLISYRYFCPHLKIKYTKNFSIWISICLFLKADWIFPDIDFLITFFDLFIENILNQMLAYFK